MFDLWLIFLLYVLDPDITNGNGEVEPTTPPPQKLLILDARSYAAAVANRAKGGGCECPGTHACLCFCVLLLLYCIRDCMRQVTGSHINGIKCKPSLGLLIKEQISSVSGGRASLLTHAQIQGTAVSVTVPYDILTHYQNVSMWRGWTELLVP